MIYRSEHDQGKMKVVPYAGMYDFDGGCAPSEDLSRGGTGQSFTLGIFIWVTAAKGKRLKRGNVIKRFRGYRTKQSVIETYATARKFCEHKNNCKTEAKR